MTTSKIIRAFGLALLVLVPSPAHDQTGSAEASPPAPVIRPAAAATESRIVVLEAGQTLDEARLARDFVVVRRADGRVPRAYLWDEPLGCPGTHSR